MNIFLNNAILLMVIFNSCMQEDDVKKALMSGDRDGVIEAAIWIQKHEVKDTLIAINLLTHILDVRICTSMEFYMQTPYRNRILALEKVTGLKCPYKIEDNPNALIVDYYLEWAKIKGLIKSKDDIDVVPPYIKKTDDSKSFKEFILNHEKVIWLDKYDWEKPPLDNDRFHN